MDNALEGITVLEVGTMTPGKFTGFLLAGWGASSVRIERPGTTTDEPISDEDLTLNRGKRSITLNLRSAEGRDILLQLAARADVFMESYRPGTAKKLGIDADSIRTVNPDLVYCSLSGFGQSGPDRLRTAYDLNIQSETAFSRLLAGRSEPAVPDTYLADSVSGLMAAFAIAAALRKREVSGKGSVLDLGVQESLFSLLAISHGIRREADPPLEMRAAYGIFKTSDGTPISLGVARPASANALFGHLGRPDLAEIGLQRGVAGAEARRFLTQALAEKPAHHWIKTLIPLGVEIAPVNSVADAYRNEQLVDRSMVIETNHPAAGPLQQIGIPGVDARNLEPAPHIGADTDAILKELEFEPDAIDKLRADDVI